VNVENTGHASQTIPRCLIYSRAEEKAYGGMNNITKQMEKVSLFGFAFA
jgi:hypothetical protein